MLKLRNDRWPFDSVSPSGTQMGGHLIPMVKTGLLISHPPALTSMGEDFKLIGFYFGARRPLASAW